MSPPSNQSNLKKSLTLPQTFGIALQQIIGGGVIALTGVAIGKTGGGAPVAFLLAAGLVLLSGISFAVLGAAAPVVGGTYTYVTRLVHPIAGFANMWLFSLSVISLSVYALTAGDYLHALNNAIPAHLVSIGIITFFFICNLFGASLSARIGVVLSVVMVAAFLSYAVISMPEVDWATFRELTPNGFNNLMSASAIMVFAIGGGHVIAELGGEMKNPGRAIPIAFFGATFTATLLYVVMAIPSTGVLPIDEVAFKPLSVVAEYTMSKGMFVFFILGGAVAAVIGTVNAQLIWGSKSLLAAIDDGWFPKALGKVNRRFGTPHWLLTILFVIGITPAVTGLSVSEIAHVASSVFGLTTMLVIVASYRMRSLYPELLARSPFKLSRQLHLVITVAAMLLNAYQNVLLLVEITQKPVMGVSYAIWVTIGIVIILLRWGKVRELIASGAVPSGQPMVRKDGRDLIEQPAESAS
ncbi:APC family permease [Rhizohabitans arisaemae]|uniref:APC family permease n=1 Tax=Rhizohabitans arisaemae TaxID=2720610 RepID=UPI0024B18D55|nr:APC family permease [Rhizohabitans arisaemae]